MPKPIAIGPWPAGMDEVHAPDGDAFQLSDERPARLVAGVNVDLDDDGWPTIRPGTIDRRTGVAYKNVFSGAGLLLVQDGGSIYTVDPDNAYAEVEVASGLDAQARVHFQELAGDVWYTNGIECGRILSTGAAAGWGLDIAPTPTLGTTGGAVPAGRYLVSATFVDAQGVEHAAGKSAVTDQLGSSSITVDLATIPAGAVSTRIYCTRPNGHTLFFVGEVVVGLLPVTITNVMYSEEPLRFQFMSPPIPGAGLFSYRGMLLTFKDQYLYPSYGDAHHLFDIVNTTSARPSNILAGAGLDTGFWTVCERGAFWTAGNVPAGWETVQKDHRKYAAGTLVLNGGLIPSLQAFSNVAMFVSENGLMAGLPDGSMLPLTADKLRLDVEGKTASIAYHESERFNQVLFGLS